MSLEHIFRNINDIRVFDELFSCQIDKENALFIDDIMDMLDLSQREIIQIEDSIEHLIRQQIIGIEYLEEKHTTGCPICKKTDDANLPRKKGHKTHKSEIVGTDKIEKYYLLPNKLNFCLESAVMESSFMFAEKIMKGETT